MARPRTRLLIWMLLPLALGVVLLWWCDSHVSSSTRSLLSYDLDEVPHNEVGLVLGTSHRSRGGRPNQFFAHRIEAAAALYHAGKVRHLLVSGDNSTMQYNEPWKMRAALIAAGVDSTHITLDYAGFRTLDSVVRAREVFGQQRFTVISQRFHVERAVFIARRKGIDAVGYNARDVGAYSGFRTMLREKAARVKVFLDLLFVVEPHFLGDPEIIVIDTLPTAPDVASDTELHLEEPGPGGAR